MFAYCNNNPVLFYDGSGNSPSYIANVDRICLDDHWASGYGGGGAVLFPFIFLADALGTTADIFDDWLEEQKRALADQIAESLAKSKTNHTGNMHRHHIVPQNDLRGIPAYIIIQEVFPDRGVNDPRNLVDVSSRIHARLHTNSYYILVNSVITIAYLSAGDSAAKRETNVTAALAGLKLFIGTLELL